ncbi:M20/M25/M40 family metallo-hydrolase [Listeria costaricensis]|uniref:M20/M25/M40 family metallo-hydrolase n=1 Tax=Listeria costaricensis TaxID=2026604 RepID=UPI000C079882|nr:M20/M25/M40 family metallo-hydrolase [Listeria costaricensis]
MKNVADYFEELVKIQAPSGQEEQLIEHLAEFCQTKGLSITYKGRAGLLIQLPATAEGFPPLLFNAHLDHHTNDSIPEPIFENGYYHSIGGQLGADCKVSLAAMLRSIDCLLTDNMPHGVVEWLLTTREEEGLVGAKLFDKQLITSSFGYTLDAPGRVGGYLMNSETHVTVSVDYLQEVTAESLPLTRVLRAAIHRIRHLHLSDKLTFMIDRYQVEQQQNGSEALQVWSHLQAEKNVADVLQELEEIKRCFYEAGSQYGARVDIQVHVTYPGFQITKEHAAFRLFQKAARNVGIATKPVKEEGGSDANILNEAGITTILLAAGYEAPHKPDERVSVAELEHLVELILALITCSRGISIPAVFQK